LFSPQVIEEVGARFELPETKRRTKLKKEANIVTQIKASESEKEEAIPSRAHKSLKICFQTLPNGCICYIFQENEKLKMSK